MDVRDVSVEQEVPAESDSTCMMRMRLNHRGWGTASKARVRCWPDALGGPMDTAGESGSNHQHTARTTGKKLIRCLQCHNGHEVLSERLGGR